MCAENVERDHAIATKATYTLANDEQAAYIAKLAAERDRAIEGHKIAQALYLKARRTLRRVEDLCERVESGVWQDPVMVSDIRLAIEGPVEGQR